MAGYDGFRMSNNAVAAYEDGEKPMSKWTKTEILWNIQKAVNRGEIKLNCSMDLLRKLSAADLRFRCLYLSSWHHTSKHYNKTDFYSLDIDSIEELTDEKIVELIAERKRLNAIKEPEPVEETWKCAFLEWSGSRKHPKATEVIEVGIVKNGWFYRENGHKKSTRANGFRYIERIQ